MKKQYFAWKNGKQTVDKQDWVELTPDEFIEICNNNLMVDREQRRFFYQLPGFEEGDDYLYLECTFEQYKVSRAEKQIRTRRRKEKEKMIEKGQWFSTVSFDSPIEGENGETCTLHELVPDPDAFFESNLIMNIDLYNALDTLSIDERDLIYDLFFDPDREVSVSELAREKGLSQQTLNYRKLKIFEKIKKIIL